MNDRPTGSENEERPRQEVKEGVSGSGWSSTEEAAAVLGVSPRTVRDYIRSGALEDKSEGVGVLKRWLVSEGGIREMLEKRRSKRQPSGDLPRNSRKSAAIVPPYPTVEDVSRDSSEASESTVEPQEVSQNLAYRLGYAHAQLDIAQRLGINLQAGWDRQLEDLRRERDQAQEEERMLRENLEAERDKRLRLMMLAGILLVLRARADKGG